MQQNEIYSDLTEVIIGCCFDVINELGSGFLESVYKRSLVHALMERGFSVEMEKGYEVLYKGQRVGNYFADIVVCGVVLVELKCCEKLVPENHAQVINYLKASGLSVGLLVNFGKRKIEYFRLHHPSLYAAQVTR